MLAIALKSYVSSINDGGVPTVANAWDAMKQMQSHRARTTALTAFKAKMGMDEDGEQWQFPTDTERLKSSYRLAKAHALAVAESDVFEPDAAMLTGMKRSMKDEFRLLVNRNTEELNEQAESLLRREWAPIHASIANSALHGWDALMDAWASVQKRFVSVAPPGCDPDAILSAFLSNDVVTDLATVVRVEQDRHARVALAKTEAQEASEKKLLAAVQQHDAATAALKAQMQSTEDELRSRLDAAEAGRREAEQAIAKGRADAHLQQAELQIQKNSLEDRAAELAARLETLTKENKELRQTLNDSRKAEMEATKETEVVRVEFAKDRELHRLHVVGAAERESELESRLEALQRSEELNKEKRAAGKKKLDAMEQELSALKVNTADQLRQADTRVLAVEESARAKENELLGAAELARVKATAEMETQRAMGELTSAENERLTKLLDRLQDDSQTTVQMMKQELDKEPATSDQAMQQVAVLEERGASLERQLQVAVADGRERESRIDTLRCDLEEARLSAARMEAEHAAATKELELHIDGLKSEQSGSRDGEISPMELAHAELDEVQRSL